MDDKTALGFNTICNFIRDLNASFGSKQKSLMLYGHLIEKTGLIHIEPVKKHIHIFRAFVENNAEAIEARNRKLLRSTKISYSERVAIDLQSIFQTCDRDEESVIWNHLLTISAVLYPEGKAKKVLQDIRNTKPTKNEDNFLKNIIDKIGGEIENQQKSGDDVNPMQMIGTMMSSGVLNDVFQSLSSGMNDGNLDLGSMMNSMQGLMSNLNNIIQERDVPSAMSASSSSSSTTATTTNTSTLGHNSTTPDEVIPTVLETTSEPDYSI